jgi:hypothetical protein
MTKKLTDDIRNIMVNSLNVGESTDELTSNLKSVIENFKREVQENSSLTFNESRALVAFTEFINNSIADIIIIANSLNTNSGGRIQGWFSRLISVVVTAVVSAVVVVCAVVTAGVALGVVGATWFGTAVAVGAIVGAVYGGAVGYDMAVTHNSYFTDFNLGNIRGGFLNWEHCSSNPGHWACI